MQCLTELFPLLRQSFYYRVINKVWPRWHQDRRRGHRSEPVWKWTSLYTEKKESSRRLVSSLFIDEMGRLMTKLTKWLCPAKTQISLGIRPVWSESSLCAQWVAKDPAFFMRTAKTLIRLGGCPGWSKSLLGTHAILLVLSWRGSDFIATSISDVPSPMKSSKRNKTCTPSSCLIMKSW